MFITEKNQQEEDVTKRFNHSGWGKGQGLGARVSWGLIGGFLFNNLVLMKLTLKHSFVNKRKEFDVLVFLRFEVKLGTLLSGFQPYFGWLMTSGDLSLHWSLSRPINPTPFFHRSIPPSIFIRNNSISSFLMSFVIDRFLLINSRNSLIYYDLQLKAFFFRKF